MNQFNIVARYYQSRTVNLLFKYLLKNKEKNPLAALPTGSGKTIVLGMLIKMLRENFNWKIAIVSHTQEILEQDYKTAIKFLPPEDVGVNSSSLGFRHVRPVTICGIQSVYKSDSFNDYDLILVDEAHLIPSHDNGMYKEFINKVGCQVVGLTATPYRLGDGFIYGDGSFFDDLVVDYTSRHRFNELVKKGYISPIRTYEPVNEFDTNDLHTRAGDFIVSEMSARYNRGYVTNKCIGEIVANGSGYKKWLIFCIDIEHAEEAVRYFKAHGVKAAAVHSKMNGRTEVIESFSKGEIRALINVDMLTTGYDDPEIDLIGILRPTKSPVIHVQTIGRGLRIAPGKDHCMVMDFAGNTKRLGPINDVNPVKKSKGDGTGESPIKKCPDCGFIHHPLVKRCHCGYKFLFEHGLAITNAGNTVIKETNEKWLSVDDVMYKIHTKRSTGNKSILVSYISGMKIIKEWVFVENDGWLKEKANNWMMWRGAESVDTVDDFMKVKERIKKPEKIKIRSDGKYPEIIEYKF